MNNYRIITALFFLSLPILVCQTATSSDLFEVTWGAGSDRVICEKATIKNGSLSCLRGNARYLYPVDQIKNIAYNGTDIFPYKNMEIVQLTDLGVKNCESILDSITGPFLLEEHQDIFLLVGTMFENGICFKKNYDSALYYYKKSGELGRESYSRLIYNLSQSGGRADLDKSYLESLQKDADRKRRIRAEWDAKCQRECTIEDKVESKFRYSVQCHNDCMSHMPD